MPYRCSKKFRFEAAHALTQLPKGHKCHNLHGHGYEVTITLEAPSIPHYEPLRMGMVLDFGIIAEWWKTYMEPLLDHRNLNEVPVFEKMPLTAECLAEWIFDKCSRGLRGAEVYSVRVQETPTCWAEYMRDEE